MRATIRGVLLASCSAALTLGLAWASDAPQTADLRLQQLKPADALTLLRTMVGARQLEIVDEHTIRISDAPETVLLAKTLVELAEHPSEVAERIPTQKTADGTVVASVRLRRASLKDASAALRSKLAIARMAMNSELSTLMIRDRPDQVAAALDLIRGLERSGA